MNSVKFFRKGAVKLDNHLFRALCESRSITHACAEHYRTIIEKISSLNHRYIHTAKETVTNLLSKFRKVKVKIMHLMRVEALAKVAKALIRCAHVHCVGSHKSSVAKIACRSAGEYIDFERFSFCVETFCHFCHCHRHHFRCAGCGKS